MSRGCQRKLNIELNHEKKSKCLESNDKDRFRKNTYQSPDPLLGCGLGLGGPQRDVMGSMWNGAASSPRYNNNPNEMSPFERNFLKTYTKIQEGEEEVEMLKM